MAEWTNPNPFIRYRGPDSWRVIYWDESITDVDDQMYKCIGGKHMEPHDCKPKDAVVMTKTVEIESIVPKWLNKDSYTKDTPTTPPTFTNVIKYLSC